MNREHNWFDDYNLFDLSMVHAARVQTNKLLPGIIIDWYRGSA